MEISSGLTPDQKRLFDHDLFEIDNPDEHHIGKLYYMDRFSKIIGLVERYYPDSKGIRVGELGCAQGNFSLLLVERGYSVYALDINKEFIDYSKLKYEQGEIQWINTNVDIDFLSELLEGRLNVIILGELLEHCAYPEEIILKSLSLSLKKMESLLSRLRMENNY